jgi:hypothetical protein
LPSLAPATEGTAHTNAPKLAATENPRRFMKSLKCCEWRHPPRFGRQTRENLGRRGRQAQKNRQSLRWGMNSPILEELKRKF